MNLLITGGAGFIGSNFIHYMMKHHPTDVLVNYDLLTYAGNLANLKDVANQPNYQFVRGDICDNKLLESVIDRFAIAGIVNLAAESHVDRSIMAPAQFVRTNILGTQTLLQVAKRKKVRKFLQVSTDEVYGSLGSDGRFTELSPLAPNSPYAASKASADLMVHAYFKTYHMNMNITRCSNNFGSYQFPEKLIPLTITHAIEDKKVPVYGDGKNIRDWLYVMDHCSAIDSVLHRGSPGEIYNVGGRNEMSNIELVKAIIFELGKSRDLIKFVNDRPGHDRRYAIDPSKIETELGWKVRFDYHKAFKETIRWYVHHEEWWKK